MINNFNKKSWSKPEDQKEFDLKFGKLLSKIRKSLGYSREKLLDKLSEFYDGEQHISDDYYGCIERGEKSISAYKLLLLIQYLNTDIEKSNSQNGTNIKKLKFDELLGLIENNWEV